MSPYQTKDIKAEIKDVNVQKRTVTGYFSVFGVKDSDGDIIQKGAFAKSVRENGPNGANRIMHLYQHSPMMPLAKPSTLTEDTKGLLFTSTISDTSYGSDALKLYNDGVLTEHSIGFSIIHDHPDETANANVITEIKLWEGSTVTWGANQFAGVVGMKSEDKDGLLEYYNNLSKAFYSGEYTDDTFRILEAQKTHIEALLKKALASPEPNNITPGNNRAATVQNAFLQFNRKFQIGELTDGFGKRPGY